MNYIAEPRVRNRAESCLDEEMQSRNRGRRRRTWQQREKYPAWVDAQRLPVKSSGDWESTALTPVLGRLPRPEGGWVAVHPPFGAQSPTW